MKKNYQSPVTQTVNVETENLLGEAASVRSNVNFVKGSGSDQAARGRESSWDDEY